MCARYDKEWIASLLDAEDRLGDVTPERCLRDAGVTAGQTVVDYGCGPGLFTFPAAEIVGAEGKVYAVDIEPRMTALIATRAAELGSRNVTALLNEGVAPLPSGTADFLILAQVLHYPDETDERVAMARDVARLLRADGRALVVEWTPNETNNRIPPEEVARIFGEAGLEAGEPRPLGPRQYAIVAAHG